MTTNVWVDHVSTWPWLILLTLPYLLPRLAVYRGDLRKHLHISLAWVIFFSCFFFMRFLSFLCFLSVYCIPLHFFHTNFLLYAFFFFFLVIIFPTNFFLYIMLFFVHFTILSLYVIFFIFLYFLIRHDLFFLYFPTPFIFLRFPLALYFHK